MERCVRINAANERCTREYTHPVAVVIGNDEDGNRIAVWFLFCENHSREYFLMKRTEKLNEVS